MDSEAQNNFVIKLKKNIIVNLILSAISWKLKKLKREDGGELI